jgi:RecG-like helicase
MLNDKMLKVIADIKKVGFEDPEDILLYLPIKYHDYTETVSCLRDGFGREDNIFVRLRTKAEPEIVYPSKANKVGRVTVRVFDGYESGIINCFGGVWDWVDLQAGQDIYVVGKVSEWNNILTLKGPKLIPATKLNQIVSQYRSKSKMIDKKKVEFTSDHIQKLISLSFNDLVNKAVLKICNFSGLSEHELIEKTGGRYSSIRELLLSIHFPKEMDETSYSEDVIKKIHGNKILSDVASVHSEYNEKSVIDITPELVKELLVNVPFTLNKEQKQAIWDSIKTLKKPITTQHLISGDVGCGKTVVYGIIAASAYLLGKQVTVLLPNLPLASQVAKEIASMWPNVDVELLQEGSKYKYDSSNKKIIVGTTAILGWSVKNKGFESDIVIVDEQQKVGVNQKNTLVKAHTNVIEATATALPRTTMLALTGAYTISKIEEPPVKKEIDSLVIFKDDKKVLFDTIKKVVDEGNQVAILYPLKSESSSITFILKSFGIVRFKVDFLLPYIELIKKVIIHTENGMVSVSGKKFFAKNSKLLEYPIHSIDFTRDAIDKGLGGVFLSNNIETKIEDRITDVVRAQEEWEKHFPNNTVMMHGGLKDEEKLEAVELAKSGKKAVIIASSMIEIGLTFPNLRALAVVDPQNMGVSTLHQIRGRLSRLGGYGCFYMYVNKFRDEVTEEYIQRLRLLEKFNKGSKLAEQDMLLRGFGDLSNLGVSQSGMSKSIFIGAKVLPEDLLSVINE